MERKTVASRADWPRIVEGQGMHYHTIDDVPYWDESAYYLFSAAEIDAIEKATYELDRMCLAAVEHVLEKKLFDRFLIAPDVADYVARSWETDETTIYGRFDLWFDGQGPPRLLEYNADTPTALLEASVIQWHWFKDVFGEDPRIDQFNSVHERLIEAWKSIRDEVGGKLYFTSMAEHLEDYMTVNYLRDTAIQAGFETEHIGITDIGWNEDKSEFRDLEELPIWTIFKLYPWEWMLADEFGAKLLRNTTRWLEPPWKMLLSNKAILPVLSELFPDSPYLLKASFEPIGDTYIRKPILAREGANISIVQYGVTTDSTNGAYSKCPSIYQELCPLPGFAGNRPVVGSWMVNGYACGMGIREDTRPITQNTSRFVPHVFAK